MSNDGGSIDFAASANYVIFDILGDLCYGKDFGLIHSSKDRYVTQLLSRTTRFWYMLGYHPWTHLLRYLLFKTVLKSSPGLTVTWNNSRFREFCVLSLMERVRKEKMSENANVLAHDMFHHLLKAREPETSQGFSLGDLGAESVLLMIAGTHITSLAIAAIIFYLAKNKEKLEKAAAEIQDAFSSTEHLNYQRLAILPYLRACIQESLRLCPPTAGHLQREVLSAGIEVDGTLYPAGTNIGISAYALQRNPLIWTEPDEYRPERWLGEDSTFLHGHQSGLIAFISGPLGCPGKQLAYMEMSIVASMLIYHFDMTLVKPDADEENYVIEDCYVGQGRGPHVLLYARTKPV